jgi:drug/metabolite transporter (DMT)-like permease
MAFLVFSVLTNAAIYWMFKWFEQLGIRIFQAIVINYLTAFTLGLLLIPDFQLAMQGAQHFPNWCTAGLALGVIFISIFYLMAITAQKVGVGVTTIASKMSLAMATLLYIIAIPEMHLTFSIGAAIFCAVVGVVCSSYKKDSTGFHWRFLFLPLAILLGSTVIDFGIGWFSAFPENDSEEALFSCLSFGTAFITGIGVMLWRFSQGLEGWRVRDVLAGVFLGVVNYGSILFLVKSYNSGVFSQAVTLAVNNLSVVLFGALGAAFIFKEKISKLNFLGLCFSILAIYLMIQVE